MTTVWKFPLTADTNNIRMPAGARPLHVDVQGGLLGGATLWAQVDPDAEPAPRTFHVVGTGHPMPDVPLQHVGSALTPNGGAVVIHVFEEVPRG